MKQIESDISWDIVGGLKKGLCSAVFLGTANMILVPAGNSSVLFAQLLFDLLYTVCFPLGGAQEKDEYVF